MVFKFYKAKVTVGGYAPDGHCQATLQLDDARNPVWSGVSPEFQEQALPWFSRAVRSGAYHSMEPLKPYSDEALEHLQKHQLPSVGYMMVTISGSLKPKKKEPEPAPKEEAKEEKKPPPPMFPPVGFTPPPHIFKKD